MRMTQYVGLNPEAQDFLKEINAESVLQHQITTGIADEPVMGSVFKGNEPYDCYGDVFYNDVWFCEVVQCEIWSSGPIIFTCLVDMRNGNKRFEWTEEEMNEMS